MGEGELELRLEPVSESTARFVAEGPTEAITFIFSLVLTTMAADEEQEEVGDVSPS